MTRAQWVSRTLLIAVALLITVGSAAAQIAPDNPTSQPLPTAIPTVMDLGDSWQLTDQTTTEETEQPRLSISVSIPVLTGANSDVVEDFNTTVQAIVTENVEPFKNQTTEIEAHATLPPEITDLGSSIDLSYEIFIANSDLMSIRFNIGWYTAGAAHPGSYSIPLNYDLAGGKVLTLADLFKPDSQYLELLSIYAIQSLNQTGAFMFPEGAEPIEENYRSWNITADGLLVTFDSYQVAPYAAGPMEVLVAYSAMAGMMHPNGPLAMFINTESTPA